MPWKCFIVEPTDRAVEYLSRHALPSRSCYRWNGGGHHATIRLGEKSVGHLSTPIKIGDDFSHDDPRWPVQCACGYLFSRRDIWQHRLERIYVGRLDGVRIRGTITRLPPGAMYTVDGSQPFAVTFKGEPGVDGKYVFVKLPGQIVWEVEEHRHGTPPSISLATPVQADGVYSGWLAEGVLTDDSEGRLYDRLGRLIR